MTGAAIIVAVVVVVLPVLILMSAGVFAAVFGASLKGCVERAHEGSELIDLNR
jgi:hypothetical protein